MRWFRLYSELIDDPKQSQMDDKTFRIFVLLMCFAAEREKNGVLDLSEKNIAWRLRISTNLLTRVTKILTNLSIIDKENGYIRFLNWDKRQFRSDCSTERVKRFRNVTVTVDETAPETETDTDKKQSTIARTRKKESSPKPADRIRPNGSGWDGITEYDREIWARAYPAVNIDLELAKALSWHIANPKKTKSNWHRFLTNWLASSQEKGGGLPSNKPKARTIEQELPL